MQYHLIEQNGTALGFNGEIPNVASDILSSFPRMYEKVGFTVPWTGYLVSDSERLIGTCAFKGPPLKGGVEIAYFTFPDFERRGYATRMAQHLVELARTADPAIRIFAQTLPTEGPSTAVLRRAGFVMKGIVHHPEDGEVWEWDRS